MSDDVSWFWAGEYGRDQILRENIDDLHAQLSQSSRQSYRLSSQLAELSGSIDARLQALSIAFDAYVELGDVREQLAGYPDTSQIRREAREALTAVLDGRPARPVDDRGLPYWLPFAVNAVLAIAAGGTDPAAEETARSLSPDSELFVVAAAGAVGRGEAVRDRLPVLLTTDEVLSQAQQALWRAACAGIFGPVEEVLAEIEPLWRTSLAADLADHANPADPAEPADGHGADSWTAWVKAEAGDGPAAITAWLQARTSAASDPSPKPSAAAPPAGAPDAGAGLRDVVSVLAGQGMGEEIALLHRARELRARIESPTAARGREATVAEPRPVTVRDVVRRTFADTGVGSPAQRVVRYWLAPALSAVLTDTEQRAARRPNLDETVTTSVGSVSVGIDGADPAASSRRIEEFRSAKSPTPLVLFAFGGLAVLTVVVAIVLIATGNSGSAVLFGLLALAGVIGVVHQLWRRRAAAVEIQSEIVRFQERIDDARATVRAREQRWHHDLEQIRRTATETRLRLESATALEDSSTLR